MIKLYFKQAWQLLKQNKLFSSIYIIGTGLALSMVMVLAIVYYIRVAPIYPETNRGRMLYVYKMEERSKNENGYSCSAVSYRALKDYFYQLKTPQTVAAALENEESLAQMPGSDELIPIDVKQTDVSFWSVFPFRFVDGKSFSQADFESGIRSAVVSQSLARKLFGTDKASGARFTFDFQEYRVSGVVKDASRATPDTFADVWIPYTLNSELDVSWGATGMLGPIRVYILAKSPDDFNSIRMEINETGRKMSALLPEWTVGFFGQPDTHFEKVIRGSENEVDIQSTIIRYGVYLFILLLVPSINLIAITTSKMEKRISELGIRKAFGAGRGVLMKQMLTENLLLTLIGGALGLFFSLILTWMSRNWILEVGEDFAQLLPDGASVSFSPEMLFNPFVFLTAFLVCFIINLLSALLPAWKFSRKNIVDSLNYKK